MRKLIDLRVVLILEAHGLGERVDRLRGTSQKMPPCVRTRTAVTFHVVLLLGGRYLWRLSWIEADRDYLEFLAHIELHQPHRAAEAGQRLSAQHGAVVVDEVQDQRLLAEIVPQLHRLASLIAEGKIRGHLAVETLLDANVLESRRTHIRGRRHNAFAHPLAPRRD